MAARTRKRSLPRSLETVLVGGLALLLVATLAATCPAAAQARGAKKKSTPRPVSEEPSNGPESSRYSAVSKFGAQALDVILLRPMGAVATAGGVAFFVLSSPLTAVSTATDFQTSWDIFVQAPWDFTVERPLGDL